MKETQEEKLLQVRIQKELAEKAGEKAKKSGLTLSAVVRNLIAEYVENPQAKLIF